MPIRMTEKQFTEFALASGRQDLVAMVRTATKPKPAAPPTREVVAKPAVAVKAKQFRVRVAKTPPKARKCGRDVWLTLFGSGLILVYLAYHL